MAEALAMYGVTILRRARFLKKDSAEGIQPDPSTITMSETDAYDKWRTWVKRESKKRLVYFAFTMDAHVSMSRNIPTLFSCAEMETPLPSSSELWSAETAADWSAIVAKKTALCGGVPSLAEALASIVQFPACRDVLDTQCGNIIILAGLWGLIREYRQSSRLISPDLSLWSNSTLSSRHNELCTAMRQFGLQSEELEAATPEVRILQEVLSMHLYVSIEELHDYAGRETVIDAQDAKAYVENWFSTSESRQAIWHAGQVLKASKDLKPATLDHVYVLAVWQAAVVLWLYGGLSGPWNSQKSTINDERNLTSLSLDGDETPDLVKFVKWNRALPGVRTKSGELVPLTNLPLLVETVQDLIVENWKRDTLPRTVGECCRFFKVLRDSYRSHR